MIVGWSDNHIDEDMFGILEVCPRLMREQVTVVVLTQRAIVCSLVICLVCLFLLMLCHNFNFFSFFFLLFQFQDTRYGMCGCANEMGRQTLGLNYFFLAPRERSSQGYGRNNDDLAFCNTTLHLSLCVYILIVY